MTFRYILPDTPALILTTTGTDVFVATIGSLTYTTQSVIINLTEQAWERFGNRPIGDYDYEHWLPIFDDAVKYNYRWYKTALPLILSSDNIITTKGGSTSENEEIDNVTTGSVNNDVVSSGTQTFGGVNTKGGSVITKLETMPDTTSTSAYLSGRNTVNDTTTSTDSGSNGTSESISNDTINESEGNTIRTKTTSDTRKDELNINITLEIANKLEELNDLYLDRLEKYFMNRW